MQMRFDGNLGFPGGLIDKAEDRGTGAKARKAKKKSGKPKKTGATSTAESNSSESDSDDGQSEDKKEKKEPTEDAQPTEDVHEELCVDTKEIVVNGLNRELEEEMNLDLNRWSVEAKDHLASHLDTFRMRILHFFVVEVSIEDFLEIESRVLSAKEWGVETYGTVRVPLFRTARGAGFVRFLENCFIGNAKQQLLMALDKKNILSQHELSLLLGLTPEMDEDDRLPGTTASKCQ